MLPAPSTTRDDHDDRAQDDAIEASFPSSDPPSWTSLHAGSPNTLREQRLTGADRHPRNPAGNAAAEL